MCICYTVSWTSITTHSYIFFLGMRTFKTYFLGNFEIYKRVLLTTVTKGLMGKSLYWLWVLLCLSPCSLYFADPSCFSCPECQTLSPQFSGTFSTWIPFQFTGLQLEYCAQVESQDLSQKFLFLCFPMANAPNQLLNAFCSV